MPYHETIPNNNRTNRARTGRNGRGRRSIGDSGLWPTSRSSLAFDSHFSRIHSLMIQVTDIGVRRGRKEIVKGLSCTVRPGQVSVIIGQNGAGKSTLLHAVSGSLKPISGSILWDHVPMEQLNARELAKRRAVLSQQPHIAFPVRVFELVEMGTYAAGAPLTKRKKASLVDHALREVEMKAFQHRYFYTLSGGEQKRVWLAKCIAQINCCHWADRNKYLFLDEPTAGLDLQQQQKFIELVRRFVNRRHLGVLAVLHDLNLAAQFADQILLLREGRLLYAGSPKDVLTPSVLREVMGIECIVQPHPVYDCPHITTLSGPVSEQGLQQTTSAYERP